MDYWLLIVILVVLVALILLRFRKELVNLLFSSQISGGDEGIDAYASGILCEKTNKYAENFVNSNVDKEKIPKINALFEDIKQDTNLTAKKVKSMKKEALNIRVSKIILEIILHCFIYEGSPNEISRKSINENVKKLKLAKNSATCFENIDKIIEKSEEIIKFNEKNEQKVQLLKPDVCFRKLKILEMTRNSCEINELQDELTRKNILLREKAGIDPLDVLKLQNCERDRSYLQEKVYDLRRELENLRISARNSINDVDLRTRLDDCLRQKTQILNDLQVARVSHDQRESEIRHLEQELRECHEIVSALSNQ